MCGLKSDTIFIGKDMIEQLHFREDFGVFYLHSSCSRRRFVEVVIGWAAHWCGRLVGFL